MFEAAQDVERDGQGDRQRDLRRAREQRLEVAAFDVLHRDEVVRALLPEVDHRDDVLVLERRGGLRFPLEAADELLVFREVGMQFLERDGPIERRLNRAVDHAHPAGPDLLEDPEVPDDPRVGHWSHRTVARLAGSIAIAASS